ncbi:MAG TPA: energy transducer TonB [Verrucomicrobiae bacterium]|nr:energy transducer TonB [Verrucomicrobiae bacterium]
MKTKVGKLLLLIAILVAGYLHGLNAQDVGTVNDKDIKIVHFEELKYPTFARAAHIEGAVVVRVFLDGQGNAVKAIAISGKDALITDSIANARKWKFQPNTQRTAVIVYIFTLPTAACGSVTSIFMLQGANIATITGCPAPVEP